MATNEQYLEALRRQPSWSIFRSWRPRYTNENGGVSCHYKPMDTKTRPLIVQGEGATWLESKGQDSKTVCKKHLACTIMENEHYWINVQMSYHAGVEKRNHPKPRMTKSGGS